jgi:hypothetical protein
MRLFYLPPAVSFRSVFDLRLLNRLPLHIARNVRAATFERHDVIHNVTFPALRIARLPHEVIARSRAALDATILVACGGS